MELSRFKAGTSSKQNGYAAFIPEPVNHEWFINDAKVNRLLNDANRLLGELNSLSLLIPDVDFFIRMHIAKEATKSSKIEGTQTSIEEAVQNEEHIGPEKRNDWQEVHNYIDAINFAIDGLNKLPLSNRLLKQAHKKLMRGVRGKSKMRGVPYITKLDWRRFTYGCSVYSSASSIGS